MNDKKLNNSDYLTFKKIKIFEAFAGLGSQYKALKNIANEKQWEIESVGIIEWFIPAIIAYQSIHYVQKRIKPETFNLNVNISNDSKKPCSNEWIRKNTKNSLLGYWLNQSRNIAHNHFDVSTTRAKDLPNDIDIFTYSFPCQDISNQGKQQGFFKNSKTRSGLLWEIDRILHEFRKEELPKYLLLENVKAIVNKKHITTFNEWIERLNDLGYVSKVYILNSINFGSPQNRERVFLLSVLKTHKENVDFEFEELEDYRDKKANIENIISDKKSFNKKFNKYKLDYKKITSTNIKKYELLNYSNFQSENYVFDIKYSGPTLTASGALSRIKLFFGKNKIREITPEECFKYMGFSLDDYSKVSNNKYITPTKQIFLCGNSISVQVLEAIFRSLKF